MSLSMPCRPRRRPLPIKRHALAAPWLAAACVAAQAQTADAPQQQSITIYGSPSKPLTRLTEDQAAAPASVTVIDRRELDRRTINTYGDILRGVTGFSVLEYGQGLVAYDVQARGFDGGHGRNLAVFLDGMPLNVTGSQHTNGYADLAQVIPELLDRVEIVRGPFSPLAGNHAVGGSIQYTTDAPRQSSIKATLDSFGRVRALPIGSFALGDGRLLAALDVTQGKGYTQQSDLERVNLFTRYSMPLGRGVASLRVQFYDATADAPGYLDKALVESGAVSEKAALSPGIGDAKNQRNLVFNYRSDDAEGTTGWDGGWFSSVYANGDLRKRWTNFDLATPPGSRPNLGQERDRLRQAGFDVRKTTSFNAGMWPALAQLGVQLNREQVDARFFRTDADRRALAPSPAEPDVVGVDRRVLTTTRALYSQLQLQPVPSLKLTAGLRFDSLRFDNRLNPDDDSFAAAQTAGQPTAVQRTVNQASPKLGAAYALAENASSRVELYGNVARGLKSPYPFADFYGNVGAGAVPDLTISSLRSFELGVQGRARDGRWQWRTGVWNTRQAREADRNAAGLLQSFKKTERDGLDVEGHWYLTPETRLMGNVSHVRARIQAPSAPGFDHIPNVPANTATLGVDSGVAVGGESLALSFAVNFVGAQSITADDSVRTRPYQRLTVRAAYPLPGWKGASLSLNLVGSTRRLEETAFDFGGGAVGISPRPRLQATVGLQAPL
jgi:outer membrane receptor protein involved in Fe transport